MVHHYNYYQSDPRDPHYQRHNGHRPPQNYQPHIPQHDSLRGMFNDNSRPPYNPSVYGPSDYHGAHGGYDQQYGPHNEYYGPPIPSIHQAQHSRRPPLLETPMGPIQVPLPDQMHALMFEPREELDHHRLLQYPINGPVLLEHLSAPNHHTELNPMPTFDSRLPLPGRNDTWRHPSEASTSYSRVPTPPRTTSPLSVKEEWVEEEDVKVIKTIFKPKGDDQLVREFIQELPTNPTQEDLEEFARKKMAHLGNGLEKLKSHFENQEKRTSRISVEISTQTEAEKDEEVPEQPSASMATQNIEVEVEEHPASALESFECSQETTEARTLPEHSPELQNAPEESAPGDEAVGEEEEEEEDDVSSSSLTSIPASPQKSPTPEPPLNLEELNRAFKRLLPEQAKQFEVKEVKKEEKDVEKVKKAGAEKVEGEEEKEEATSEEEETYRVETKRKKRIAATAAAFHARSPSVVGTSLRTAERLSREEARRMEREVSEWTPDCEKVTRRKKRKTTAKARDEPPSKKKVTAQVQKSKKRKTRRLTESDLDEDNEPEPVRTNRRCSTRTCVQKPELRRSQRVTRGRL